MIYYSCSYNQTSRLRLCGMVAEKEMDLVWIDSYIHQAIDRRYFYLGMQGCHRIR